jgi:hypothetical protein
MKVATSTTSKKLNFLSIHDTRFTTHAYVPAFAPQGRASRRQAETPALRRAGTIEGKEGSLCHTEWDHGDIILMDTEEVGGGAPGGTGDLFPHGDLQPKKRRFGFLKKKAISFGMS